MPDDARQRLAVEQGRLVDALTRRADTPPGFDPARIDLTATTLASKRAKTVAKLWPALAEAMGDQFLVQLKMFAAVHPSHPAGPISDAFAFAKWLDGHGLLPRRVAADFLIAQLRNGPPIGLRIRRGERRLFIGLRLPGLGVRWIAIPWRAELFAR